LSAKTNVVKNRPNASERQGMAMTTNTVTKGLLVRIEALPGREDDVAQFLKDGLSLVEQEPDTTAWFAVRLGPSTFGIFDVFPDDSGRQAHLSGKVAAALMENAGAMFEQPSIEQLDVIASKLP
jgi:quinol monooxygenase YgiN